MTAIGHRKTLMREIAHLRDTASADAANNKALIRAHAGGYSSATAMAEAQNQVPGFTHYCPPRHRSPMLTKAPLPFSTVCSWWVDDADGAVAAGDGQPRWLARRAAAGGPSQHRVCSAEVRTV